MTFFFSICESARVVYFENWQDALHCSCSNLSCPVQLNAASFKTRHIARILNRAELRATGTRCSTSAGITNVASNGGAKLCQPHRSSAWWNWAVTLTSSKLRLWEAQGACSGKCCQFPISGNVLFYLFFESENNVDHWEGSWPHILWNSRH